MDKKFFSSVGHVISLIDDDSRILISWHIRFIRFNHQEEDATNANVHHDIFRFNVRISRLNSLLNMTELGYARTIKCSGCNHIRCISCGHEFQWWHEAILDMVAV